MKSYSTVAAFAGLALTLAAPVWAQTIRLSEVDNERTKQIELGVGLEGLIVPYGGGTWSPSAQARVNLSSRFAVDVRASFDTGQRDGIYGMYSLQVHQTVGQPHRRVTPFVTYGANGTFEYVHYSESRVTYSNGDTAVYPGFRHSEISTPFAIVCGGGYRVRLASHAFLEAGAQALLPIGYWIPAAVFNAGVTVPLGR